MDRKKELKELYKQMKKEMGVFVFLCKPTNQSYIGHTKDTKGTLNSIRFQLSIGSFRNKKMLEAWNDYGEENFTINILETLDYDKNDESKTDYREELTLLKEICKEKMENVIDIV